MNKVNDSHVLFNRAVGRILGVLDMIRADENAKRTIKAYIWQLEKDVTSTDEAEHGKETTQAI